MKMLVSLCVVVAVSYIVAPIYGVPNPDPAPVNPIKKIEGAFTGLYNGIGSWFQSSNVACFDPSISVAVKWSPVRDACIRGNNIKHYNRVKTIDKCQDLCITYSANGCQSIDYVTNTAECWISKGRSDNNNDFTEPCYDGSQSKFTEIIHENGNRPETRCWEKNHEDGNSQTYYGCDKKLEDTGMNDKISSYTQKGVWVYYGDHFKDDVHVQITSGHFGVVNKNNDKWSSLRYAGVDDYTKPSWTLYEHDWFQGDNIVVGGTSSPNLEHFSDKAGSLITIGLTDWTFYNDVNYGGQCFTVRGGSSSTEKGGNARAAVLVKLHQLDMNDKISSVREGKDSRCNYIDPIYIGSSGGYSQNDT